jgi:type VI secretion system secreted protein Hcp
MPIRAYLTLKGQKQGEIKGAVTQKGREGTIEIFDLSYAVTSPRDAQSGLPTGKRQHKPVILTAATGPQTPLVFNAATQNENITTFKLDFYMPNPAGVEKNAFRIELVNASVSEYDLNFEGAEAGSLASSLLDQYSFTFQKITLTWLSPAISASDDWESPVS